MIGVALALVLAAPAYTVVADPMPMRARLFANKGFRGPYIDIDASKLALEPNWATASIQVWGNGSWRMCSDTLFEGQCIMVTRNIADLKITLGWSGSVASIANICSTPLK